MRVPYPLRGAARGLSARLWRPIADVLAALMTLTSIAWALSFQRTIGLDLYPQQYFAAILFFVMPIAFLTMPLKKGGVRDIAPWFDVALALLSAALLAYIFVAYPKIVLMIFSRSSGGLGAWSLACRFGA